MKYRYVLAITAGLASLTAGAGIAAAQSDDDATPSTTVEPSTDSTTDPATDSTTDPATDSTTEPTDDGTGVPSTDEPEAGERPAAREGCGDDAAGDTPAETEEDTGGVTDDSSS